MRNKIVMITAALAVMMALTGIAAADPARVDIKPGDDSNPLYHPMGGATVTYPVLVYEMPSYNVVDTRYIEVRANSGLTSVRLYGNGIDITAAGGSSNSAIYSVPAFTTSQTFNIDVITSTPGEVIILTNRGTSLLDATPNPQDFGSASSGFIPEFATVAIPIAAVLGLVFFFQQRKNKKE